MATKAELERQVKRLKSAVRWAMGDIGDFPGRPRKPNEGSFWWRTELKRRAGLRWDHKRMRYVLREEFQQSEERK